MKDHNTNPDPLLWTGRASGNQQYLHEKVAFLQNERYLSGIAAGTFVLLGYACDEGVRRNLGRPGASKGPDAIRKELAKMANHLPEMANLVDAGNICCENGDMETAQQILANRVSSIIKQGGISLLMGGGHDIAYGHYQGLRSGLEASQNIGIINFDAHFDLRKNVSEGHSGSPFYQIAADCAKDGTPFKYCCLGIRPEDNPRELFDTARELNVKYMTLAEFSISNLPVITSFIGTFLADVDKVYVTLDMDGFSSAYAPGVSAASPSGFMPELIKNSISQITRSGKLLGIDVAETNPTFDRDAQTAKLAAIMLHFVMHELALF